MNPLILYSPDGKRTRRVYQIDAPGWINAGWLAAPPSLQEQELAFLPLQQDIDECESPNAEEQVTELPPQETRAPKTKAAK